MIEIEVEREKVVGIGDNQPQTGGDMRGTILSFVSEHDELYIFQR